jgi:alpha-glucosidase
MFGDSILADPVTQPVTKNSQLAKIPVWLPAGNWIEWDSGASFHGPVTLERSFSISQIPLYVKAGSIIPMQPAMSYTGERAVNPLILTVFPLQDGQVSKYRLYEDAGDTRGYQFGESVWTPIRAASSADGTVLTVSVAPAEGDYKGMRTERAYELRLPGSWPPSSVSVNGKALAYSKKEGAPGWRFEGDTMTTVITTHSFRVSDVVSVTVRIKSEMARQRAMLDGFPGKMTRLRETYDILNATWPAGWSPDRLIDAMQAGDRISYHPETAFAEVSGLPAKLASLADLLGAMRATESSPKVDDYNRLVDTALAHIADIKVAQPPQ